MPDEAQELPFKTSTKRSVGQRKVKSKPAEAVAPAAPAEPSPQPTSELKATQGASSVGRWFVRCLGAGAVIAPLAVAHNPVMHWLGVLGPIAATVAYPLIGRRLQFDRSPSLRDRFADNCYYLGFIFTQIALLVGFSPVLFLNEQLTSQDVLRAFSMALGAALVGLVARTYFTQTGHSVTENSRRIEDEVEALAAAVSKQAQGVVDQFGQLSGRLSSAYTQLDTELTACVGSLVRTVKNYEAALERDVRTFEAGTSAVTEAASDSITTIQSEQKRFVAGLEQALKGLEALRASTREQMSTATAVVQSSAEALASGARTLAGVSGVGEQIQSLETRVGAAAQAAGKLELELAGVVNRVGGIGQEALNSVSSIGHDIAERTVGRAAEIERDLSEGVQVLERTLAAFKAELERVRV